MNTISIRPRLDYRYDVIQSRFPQLLGVRDDIPAALALAEWAADRSRPAKLLIFGKDAARIEDTREYPAVAGTPSPH